MTIRAGFIGAGNRSQSAHYPNINRLPAVEMTAVCELDEGRLDGVVEKYGFQHVYTNHQEMLEQVELDVVYCVMNGALAVANWRSTVSTRASTFFIEKATGANRRDAAVTRRGHCQQCYAMVGYQRRHSAVTRGAAPRPR
ncbi:MAG: Gfo/Idh/MocA family oxidoreductase [Caldilineaceae bacterium]